MDKELFKNSIKMYENTIQEMKEKGKDTSVIESELEEVKENFNAIESSSACAVTSKHKLIPYDYMMEREQIFNCEFLRSNLWRVKVGDVPEWLIEGIEFNSSKKIIIVRIRECKYFSSISYFEKNKRLNNLCLEYLDPTGAAVRRDTFKRIKLKEIEVSPLTYSSDSIVSTTFIFSYKDKDIWLNQ